MMCGKPVQRTLAEEERVTLAIMSKGTYVHRTAYVLIGAH